MGLCRDCPRSACVSGSDLVLVLPAAAVKDLIRTDVRALSDNKIGSCDALLPNFSRVSVGLTLLLIPAN
jgi:hypothetical protein